MVDCFYVIFRLCKEHMLLPFSHFLTKNFIVIRFPYCVDFVLQVSNKFMKSCCRFFLKCCGCLSVILEKRISWGSLFHHTPTSPNLLTESKFWANPGIYNTPSIPFTLPSRNQILTLPQPTIFRWDSSPKHTF